MEENLSQTQQGVIQPTPPTTPPVQPPKGKKSIVLMIAIHLIAVAVIGYFVYQNMQLKRQITLPQKTPIASTTPTALPTTDPTANWKTYTDSKWSFSFKYPSGWTYKLGETNPITGLVTFNTNLASGNKNTNYIFEVVLETESNFNQWSKNSGQTTTLAPQTINGLIYEKYIVADMYYSLDYILKENGNIYRFVVYPYDTNQYPAELKDNIDQILSTLKFTQ
jgi:hypothetical protein